MKTTGDKRVFETGAVRDAKNEKPWLELISPIALERLGAWLRDGVLIGGYEARNWERGMPIMQVIGSLLRHTTSYWLRRDDEDHLAAILTNAMFLLHIDAMVKRGVLPSSLDDRPEYNNED